MGFYGNIVYNTYGMQEKSVTPKHLDRAYWQIGQKFMEVHGQYEDKEDGKGLRNILGLTAVTEDDIGKSQWLEKWDKAEKSIFKFYIPKGAKNSDNEKLRALLGNGYLLGWVRKDTTQSDWTSPNTWTLCILSLTGYRAGQLFHFPIDPLNNIITLPTEDGETDPGKPSDWLNNYLVGPIVTTKQIQNNSITENKINTDAVTSDKIKNDSIIEDKIPDRELSFIKIAYDTIQGGEAPNEGNIAEKTITKYNIADSTITSTQIASYTIQDINIADATITGAKIVEGTISGDNIASYTITAWNISPGEIRGGEDAPIAEKTITDYNIEDKTISADKLEDWYIKGHYGEGYPDLEKTLILKDQQNLQIGDLYIDRSTGYVYCFQGGTRDSYIWIPTQAGPNSYVEGTRSHLNNRPQPNNARIGDIWVDENTGNTYICQSPNGTAKFWAEIKSYQIDTDDIKDRSITSKKLALGVFDTFAKENLLFKVPYTNEEQGLTGDDLAKFIAAFPGSKEYPIVIAGFSDGIEHDGCFLGYSFNQGEGRPTNNTLDCLDLTNRRFVTVSPRQDGQSINGLNFKNSQKIPTMALPTNIDPTSGKPSTPNIGDLFYNEEFNCLEIYLGNSWNANDGWKKIEGYTYTTSTNETEE